MWPLIAAQAGMELGKGALGYLMRPKPPKAENTAQGRELMRRSTYGAYGPRVRRRILGSVGRASGAAEQAAVADIRGRLVNSGMDNSIAGQSLMAQPGLRRAGMMAETGERMEAGNEQAKDEARWQFATLQDQQNEARRESRRQALAGLLGAGVNAVGAGVNAYQFGQREKALGGLPDKPFKNLKAAIKGGLRLGAGDYKHFINTPDSGFTEEELEYIRSNPDLFR